MDVDKRKTALKCPYKINNIEFSQCSVANRQLQYNNYSKQNIIIGGSAGAEITFLEVQISLKDGNHVVEYKSFEKDYKKSNANLLIAQSMLFHDTHDSDCFSISAVYFHSFLLNDNKLLMTLNHGGLNVYDIEQDKWLTGTTEKGNKNFYVLDGDRVVLVTDEIFVTSDDKHLYFYFIDKNNVTHPKLLKKYTINKDNTEYTQHGIVCTNLKILETISNDHDTRARTSLKFDIIVFGGCEAIFFGESFIKFHVNLSYGNKNINIKKNANRCIGNIKEIKPIIKIKEEPMSIECSMIVNDNDNINCNDDKNKNDDIDDDEISLAMDSILMATKWAFGYQCLLNGQNEAVIIIVGGYNTGDEEEAQDQSIIVFNVARNTIKVKSKV